jgi:hypothetical protein
MLANGRSTHYSRVARGAIGIEIKRQKKGPPHKDGPKPKSGAHFGAAARAQSLNFKR